MISDLLPPPKKSWNDVLAELSEEDRDEILALLRDNEAVAASDDWFLQARREQLEPPGDWVIWALIAGRGFGKNWSASHWLINEHEQGHAKNSCIIAATSNDLVRYCLSGPSGILSLAPARFTPEYKTQHNKLVWPDKSETHLFTSEKPRRLRGGNFDRAWCDELSYWQYVDDTWDMLMFGLRHGESVKCIVSMTPRPIPLVRELIARNGKDVFVTSGSTYENEKNLSKVFKDKIIKKYEGTRMGRQELLGEVLMDVEGALWDHQMIDELRIEHRPEFKQIVVAVDPSVTSGQNADETGIVVVGKANNDHCYVLADISGQHAPRKWASLVVGAYHSYGANHVVAEKNNGGELITEVIHNEDPNIPVKLVSASVGKVARAEPVSMLYEQKRVHHIGFFPYLEDEMCMFVPGEMGPKVSPNRADALVWGITDLIVKRKMRAGTWGRSADKKRRKPMFVGASA